ncbi:hypothetical protein BB560_001656 [Smittium megazygosporum]|uniref:HMG box domain-containing protein n=1 Tax=Smittium megazygosporum TaxID=133381 RepID=A0A2T9ZGY4_9FUNG|nr:hypothetical protein BB560_001656 [Smittium megazygosporum]
MLKSWWEDIDHDLVKIENMRLTNLNQIRKKKGLRRLPLLVNPSDSKNKPTVYSFYVKDQYHKFSELPFGERMKALAEKWKLISDEEKQKYIDLSKQNNSNK